MPLLLQHTQEVFPTRAEALHLRSQQATLVPLQPLFLLSLPSSGHSEGAFQSITTLPAQSTPVLPEPLRAVARGFQRPPGPCMVRPPFYYLPPASPFLATLASVPLLKPTQLPSVHSVRARATWGLTRQGAQRLGTSPEELPLLSPHCFDTEQTDAAGPSPLPAL